MKSPLVQWPGGKDRRAGVCSPARGWLAPALGPYQSGGRVGLPQARDHITFSNSTAGGWLRSFWVTSFLSAPSKSPTSTGRGWGPGRKRPCLLKSPCPSSCHSGLGGLLRQTPKTHWLELDGFRRTAWLATGLGSEAGEWASAVSPFCVPGPGSSLSCEEGEAEPQS